MHTFTFIAAYKGVSAMSQHQGRTPVEAIEDWLKTFSFALFNLSMHELAVLRSDVSSNPVKRMDDFKSMWFVFSTLGRKEPDLAGERTLGALRQDRDGVFSIHILDTKVE